jgi:acyl-CoA thioester hydrolase
MKIMEQEIEINFHHSADIQIRFNDIDMLGHVNNAKLQEYFDLGRMLYLQRIFGRKMFVDDEAIVIASTKTDFLKPVYLSDHIEVCTAITSIGEKSLKMTQHLRCKKMDEPKVVCESVMVSISKSSGKSMEMPEKWKDLICSFEQKVF